MDNMNNIYTPSASKITMTPEAIKKLVNNIVSVVLEGTTIVYPRREMGMPGKNNQESFMEYRPTHFKAPERMTIPTINQGIRQGGIPNGNNQKRKLTEIGTINPICCNFTNTQDCYSKHLEDRINYHLLVFSVFGTGCTDFCKAKQGPVWDRFGLNMDTESNSGSGEGDAEGTVVQSLSDVAGSSEVAMVAAPAPAVKAEVFGTDSFPSYQQEYYLEVLPSIEQQDARSQNPACQSLLFTEVRIIHQLRSVIMPKRKPVFVKVSDLKPGTNGHTLVVKVLTATTVLDKKSRNNTARSSGGGHTRITECLIGDETGTVLFTARNDQVDLMKPDTTVIIRNAKIDMFKGSIRLAVDKWGRIEVTEPASFTVKEDNNLSLIEYELVNVEE
ncbi:Nucleic acid-binding, OB-fold [Artemisia annua]|uniref:Nucleic acid-binding, OB-fold n=1 Tax=Artemisia annua TaxID=35608 RepID=A0A2U1QDH2_ARTAN|nr:Nucleic acid-binding, OB-fold [Artemisia annua]